MSTPRDATRRILLIAFNIPYSPSDTRSPGAFLIDFARALVACGHVVSILAPDHGSGREQEPFEGLQIERFAWSGRLPEGAERVGFRPELMLGLGSFFRQGLEIARRETMRLDPHLVIAAGTFSVGVFARGIHELFGNPYIVWAQQGDLEDHWRTGRKRIIRSVLEQAERCTATTPSQAERLGDILEDSVAVWPAFNVLPLPPTRPAAPRARTFFYAGPLEEDSGAELLLDSFFLALPDMPGAHLILAGDGALARTLERRITPAPPDTVTLLPRLAPSAFYDRLFQADAVVIPSRLPGVPRILGEAIQARRPVLVSDVGDLPQLTRSLRLGVTFASGDRDDLADALWRAYHHGFEASAEDLRAGARALSLDAAVRGVEDALERLERGLSFALN